MKKAWFAKILMFISALSVLVSAQNQKKPQIISQEFDESDGIPILIKHLPDWENTRNRSTYIKSADELRKSLGERPVFNFIYFIGGTEAVTAPYESGTLLIVEYSSPQISIESDNEIKQFLSENPQTPPIYYRRIGNYNAFVFDAKDEAAANGLLDQIKYEKKVQWLGENPYARERAEKDYLLATGSLILTTLLMIAGGFGSSVIVGIAVGFIFFYFRELKRSQRQTYTDAGGMTRLNLDGLTPSTGTPKND